MDPIVREEKEKLPRDAETEIMCRVVNKIKSFLNNCNLGMNHKEWANESVSEEAEAFINLPKRYANETLTEELSSQVIDNLIELNCINIFNDFFLFSLKTCSTIYEKNEGYFKDQITTLEQQNTDDSLDDEISNYSVLLYTQRILSSMMTVVINCTNVSFKFCTMCMDKEFVSTIFRLLEIYLPINDDEEMKDLQLSDVWEENRLSILYCCLGMLSNISRFREFHKKLKDLGAVQKLRPYLKCQMQLFAVEALMILSYLIEESNNHLIMSDEKPIILLLRFIEIALMDPDHDCLGCRLSELIECLQLIALNDTNKATIGQNDGITILSEVLSSSNSLADELEHNLEKKLSCKALWTLSFNKENRDIIKNDNFILGFLENLCKESPDKDLKTFSGGVLWEVLGKEMRESKKEEQDNN